MSAAPRKHNPNFFAREGDGSVRLRIRFEPDEAAIFEEAAGNVPVMTWLHQTLVTEAKRQVQLQRASRLSAPPPE